jgi:hypothetical protein
MQVITHQFALERFIQSASLFKYCQSLTKCDNGRKLANVGHRKKLRKPGATISGSDLAQNEMPITFTTQKRILKESEKYHFRYELCLFVFLTLQPIVVVFSTAR